MKKIFYILLLLLAEITYSQKLPNPEDFEVWEPEPKVVVTGSINTPPSDAIIIFDGTNFDYWQHSVTKDPVKWILNKDKSMTVKLGTGSIETKFEHGSIQLHIEWKTPEVVKGSGQSRGNSGIYFQRRYEVQVLDSYQNRTYSNGQAGSIYKQSIPLVNASRPPGDWQVYDIVFNEPKYNEEGEQIKAGTFTIFHNGVLIQNNSKIQGTTSYFGMIETKRDKLTDGMQGGTNRSLMLQDHGDGEVSYRNIWIRKL